MRSGYSAVFLGAKQAMNCSLTSLKKYRSNGIINGWKYAVLVHLS
jgi:hypothetical protein